MSLVKNCSKIFPGVLFHLVALALLVWLTPTAHAQLQFKVTLNVIGTADPSPVPSCKPATVSSFFSCPSLRAAIRHANTNGNSGTDTIVLQGGSLYTLSIRGRFESDALTGDLDIRSSVRITTTATALGSIATVQGGAGWDDRIFDIDFGGMVQIENLAIQHGSAFDGGGGIANSGTLTLTNCTVTGNGAGHSGGGIVNTGTLTMTNSAVTNNSATFDGGGIFNARTLTLTNSTIANNNVSRDGGGIFNSPFQKTPLLVSATLTNSKVSENTADNGGGIANPAGVLELTGTTVSSNRAGGGISSSGGSLSVLRVTKSTISSNLGFGIFNNLGQVTLTNSTVSSNSGDGIVNAEGKVIQGEVILNNATIALNGGVGVRNDFGGVFTFSNTILADDCAGLFISHDYNLVQFPTCTVIGVFGATTHDKIGVDPLLGDLRFNGGQTQTHKPGSGSPAIDNGNPAQVGSETFPPACTSTDQTGVTRPLDGDGIDPDGSGPIPPAVCDIGAVEVRSLSLNPDANVICCVTVATTSGVLDLTPAEATVRVGERFDYAFEWTVPAGGWRSLDTLELRLVDGAEVILWVRFAEAADPPGSVGTFSLVNDRTGQEGPGFAPGSRNRLETNAATVYLDGSAAHGPPGSTVGLTLELSFKPQAAGRSYAVEVLATNDTGAGTGFVGAGTLTVLPAKPEAPTEGSGQAAAQLQMP